MSLAEIGKFLGNKNHATVLMGCKRIEDLIKRKAQIRWQSPNGNKVENAHIALEKIENNISQ